MSLHKINEVELEVDLADADFQEKFEDAFNKLSVKEKVLVKTGKLSDITREYCKMFYELFDDIYGLGTGEKLFKGKSNTTICEKVYQEYLDICSAQAKAIKDKQSKIFAKYKPQDHKRK